MRKKWSARALLALLCIAMLCSIPAYAVETRANDQIMHSTATLSKSSNGNLSVYFSVRATRVMEQIGATSVAIQHSSDRGWITEYTFTPSNAPEIQAENKFQHSTILTYSPRFTGVEYRAVVIIYVKDAAGISTQQLTTNKK